MMLAMHLSYWQQSILRTIGVLVAVLVPAGTFVYVFLFKMVSFMQSRLGPMEAGPYGSMQLFAEVGKFLQKEDIVPDRADKRLFKLAPVHGGRHRAARVPRRAVRARPALRQPRHGHLLRARLSRRSARSAYSSPGGRRPTSTR